MSLADEFYEKISSLEEENRQLREKLQDAKDNEGELAQEIINIMGKSCIDECIEVLQRVFSLNDPDEYMIRIESFAEDLDDFTQDFITELNRIKSKALDLTE